MKLMRPKLCALIVAVCAALSPIPSPAGGPHDPLRQEEVTVANLKSFFDAAYMTTSIDDDGDLRIEDGEIKSFLNVDPERKFVYMYTLYSLKADVPDARKLELANTMNEKMILARFSLNNPTTLWCDYHLLFDEAVTPFEIVNAYRRFSVVVREAVNTLDPEDIIGTE